MVPFIVNPVFMDSNKSNKDLVDLEVDELLVDCLLVEDGFVLGLDVLGVVFVPLQPTNNKAKGKIDRCLDFMISFFHWP